MYRAVLSGTTSRERERERERERGGGARRKRGVFRLAKLESARRWIWQLSFLLLFLRGSIYHSSGKAIICHCILSANRGNRCCRKVSKLGCAIPRDNSRVAWRIERSPSVVVSSIDRETITSTFHARIITISEQKGSPRGSRPE